MIRIRSLDHVVLTVADVEATCDFYARVLRMQVIGFGGGRRALAFGEQKINLHRHGSEFEPKAQHPTPGSCDLCFLSETPLDEVIRHLGDCGIAVLERPVERTGGDRPDSVGLHPGPRWQPRRGLEADLSEEEVSKFSEAGRSVTLGCNDLCLKTSPKALTKSETTTLNSWSSPNTRLNRVHSRKAGGFPTEQRYQPFDQSSRAELGKTKSPWSPRGFPLDLFPDKIIPGFVPEA